MVQSNLCDDRLALTFSRAWIRACIILIALTCVNHFHLSFYSVLQTKSGNRTCLACISVITPLSFAFRFSKAADLIGISNLVLLSIDKNNAKHKPLLLHLKPKALLTIPKLESTATDCLHDCSSMSDQISLQTFGDLI